MLNVVADFLANASFFYQVVLCTPILLSCGNTFVGDVLRSRTFGQNRFLEIKNIYDIKKRGQ